MTTRARVGLVQLAQLEDRLRELLAQLDGAQASIEAIESAWNACVPLTPTAGELEVMIAAAGPDERLALRARLESVTRLNAVAVQAAERQRELTRRKLESTRGVKTSLRNLELGASVGESCDIAG